jgi:hypothetical protein
MNKTFILAFNYEEARDYIRRQKDNPADYIILNRPEQLYGTINPKVVFTANAYKREDYNEFYDVYRTRIR